MLPHYANCSWTLRRVDSLPTVPGLLLYSGTSNNGRWRSPRKGRGVWRRSRPLLPAGTSATAAPDLAVFLNGVLSLFVGEAQG